MKPIFLLITFVALGGSALSAGPIARSPAVFGNPLKPGIGLTDPHVSIYGDRADLYATHDFSADSKKFVTKDWWVWSSTDLGHWTQAGSRLLFPNVRNLPRGATISVSAASGHPGGGTIEVRQDGAKGRLLGSCKVPETGGCDKYQRISCALKNQSGSENLCLVFSGGADELMRLDWLKFSAK